MANITASVGKGGVNKPADVEIVQKLINRNLRLLVPLRPLAENGRIDPMTNGAIEAFQRRVVGLEPPDGRVDPDGKTLRALNQNAGAPNTPAVGGPPGSASTKVTYSSKVSSANRIVSSYSIAVIQLALKKAGMPRAVITSTRRSPEEQAGIMYRNAKKNLSKQFALYGATGDEVLKVYKNNQNKPEAEVIKLMQEKIEALLKTGRRTSNHVVTESQYKALNIVDIGVNSTRAVCGAAFSIEKFTKAFEELKNDGYIDKFIDETSKSNTCWHIEVTPNKKVLPA